MYSKRFTVLVAALSVLASVSGGVAQQSGGSDGSDQTVLRVDSGNAVQFQPVPPDSPIHHYVLDSGSSRLSAVAGAPTEVYANTQLVLFVANGVNRLIADDIGVISAGGCNMTSLSFAVYRNPMGPAPAGFNISQFGIWDMCPGQPGATLLVDLLPNGPIVIATNGVTVIDLPFAGDGQAIPTTFWLAMAFNKADAGWIGGAAPLIGTSEDVIHIHDPARPELSCSAIFTPSPQIPDPYASMSAQIFCNAVDPIFTAYQAAENTFVFYGDGDCGPAGLSGCGDGINLESGCETGAESIKPIVSDCRLHGYTVEVAGSGGAFDIEFELWTDDRTDPLAPKPGVPIPGTRGCFHGVGDTNREIASFTFDGSVILPERFYLVWSDDSAAAGPIAASGPAGIGDSEIFPGAEGFQIFTGNDMWDEFVLPGCGAGECTNFKITLTCFGVDPVGACCERASATCRNGLLVRECPRSMGRWVANTDCDTALFEPPCGESGCCKVDSTDPLMLTTFCENELPSSCAAGGGEPVTGLFCSEVESCGVAACIGAQGDCASAHESPGCFDNECCNEVCQTDSFCCDTEWDDNCAMLAVLDLCNDVPPVNDSRLDATTEDVGTIQFSTVTATTDGPFLPDRCGSGDGPNRFLIGKDIWYRYTPPQSGRLTVDLCSESTNYDSRIAVYEGCDGPVNTETTGCDDDGCGTGSLRSRLEVNVADATCYLIRVGGWGEGAGSFGNGAITLSFVPQECPTAGVVSFMDPPDGTVDARLPHPLNSFIPRQGIQTIQVQAPAGAPVDPPQACFDLCETDDEASPNIILNVVENPAGLYTLMLARPISIGAVTTITYLGTNDTADYTSQPGNVNGVGGANPADVTAMVNCLNGVSQATACPHDPESRDLDFSGGLRPADLLAAVNALNGAGVLNATNGNPQPSSVGCP